jgi:hypothetical protein
MTVDREHRDALVAAINRYLDGQTTAFQFDGEIFGIRSDDPIVSHVVHSLWLFYDDCKDHKVHLSKEAWDYFQRLVLLLESDGQVELSRRRRWDFTQLVALAALLLFLYAACWFGFGMQLLAVAIPFGVVSIVISWWRGRTAARTTDPKAIILAPFSSLAELIALRRSVAKFGKRKYPPGMKPFKIRSPLEETAIWLRLYAAWLFLSPLVLLFQTLPTTETESRIVTDVGAAPDLVHGG